MGIPDDVSTRIRTIQASTDYTTITVFTDLSRVAVSRTAFQAQQVAMYSVLELSTAIYALQVGGNTQSYSNKVSTPMDILTDSEGNPILDQCSEEGFVDLTFRIRDLTDDAKHYRFHLAASHRKRTVGMDVAVVKGIQGGFNAKMNLVKKHVYRLGVRFLRSGAESDRLIAAIGQLYGAKRSPRKMVDEETFTAIALHQGRLDMESEPVKLKIFGKDGEPFDEDAYYESFFNVDLPNGFVYWNEKDPDYRQPLLRALSAG